MASPKQMARKALNRAGFDIQRSSRDGWSRLPRHMAAVPATVIDVGVGFGTDSLYEAFPGAQLLLVEALEDFAPHVDRILGRRAGQVRYTAVSDHEGEAAMHVEGLALRSSLHARTALTARGETQQRTVPVTTLDRVVADVVPPAPYVLKVDTEGHELAVLRGAEKTLADTELVVLEMSIAQRFEDSYRFEDLVAMMDEQGFGLCDVLALNHKPNGVAVRMDGVFARR